MTIWKDRRINFAPIDTSGADSQDAAPLFSIPPELRTRIYEYVFGSGGTMHFDVQECRKSDDYTDASSTYMQDDETGRYRKNFTRLHNTLCTSPDDWEHAYQLSKEPYGFTQENFYMCRYDTLEAKSHAILAMHSQRHRACERVMADFMVKSYARYCDSDGRYHAEDGRCPECQARSDHLTAKHGPAPAGLKELHVGTKLQLNILATCKRIYHEASLIPYSTLAFDLRNEWALAAFAKYMVTPPQLHAIKTIHLGDLHIHMPQLVKVLLHYPGVQHLRLSRRDATRISGEYEDWRAFRKLNQNLKSVQIICAYDEDMKDDRLSNRRFAATLEQKLMACTGVEERAISRHYMRDEYGTIWDEDSDEQSEESDPEDDDTGRFEDYTTREPSIACTDGSDRSLDEDEYDTMMAKKFGWIAGDSDDDGSDDYDDYPRSFSTDDEGPERDGGGSGHD